MPSTIQGTWSVFSDFDLYNVFVYNAKLIVVGRELGGGLNTGKSIKDFNVCSFGMVNKCELNLSGRLFWLFKSSSGSRSYIATLLIWRITCFGGIAEGASVVAKGSIVETVEAFLGGLIFNFGYVERVASTKALEDAYLRGVFWIIDGTLAFFLGQRHRFWSHYSDINKEKIVSTNVFL